MASPRDFPTLRTTRERRSTSRPYHVCNVCQLTVEPRNSRRHAAKCARLKREDPALWQLWRLDMHGADAREMRKRLGPVWCRELVARGLLEQGPLTRKGTL